MSQEELALKAGLDKTYVGYIERGERKPSIDVLTKIAKALQIKMRFLFV